MACVLVMTVLDYASGLLKAASNNSLSSSKMRAGLYSKAKNILMVLASYAIAYFGNGYIPMIETLPDIAVAYVAAMELLSIAENTGLTELIGKWGGSGNERK